MTTDVLVTGAAGFIGSQLMERLRAAGVNARGVDLRPSSDEMLQADICDLEQLAAVFESVRPRRVVHAAAIVDDRVDPDLVRRVNVDGTANVLDCCHRYAVDRLVHMSSIVVLGFDPGPMADETFPLCTDTGVAYFDTKAESEAMVLEAFRAGKVTPVVIRPGDVYGYGSVPWVNRVLKILRSRMPVLVAGGRGRMAHCHVENLLDALVLALDTDGIAGEIFQIHDGGEGSTYREYITRLARAAELPEPRVSFPRWVALSTALCFEGAQKLSGVSIPWTRGAIRYLCRQSTYSIQNSTDTLGYQPRIDLDEGMRILAEKLAVG
ncbi:MAG: hypothetical protein CMH54_11015 [Myxococcales bacterium]|nr:hypothetical protein [Myxococcales bacterium]